MNARAARKFLPSAVLLLALAIPATAAASGTLLAAPKTVSFGMLTVGACDLSTYVGCTIKTVTIKNTTSSAIAIGGYGVQSPLADVALFTLASGDCFSLATGTGWFLAPGESCLIGVSMDPAEPGRVNRSLIVFSPTQVTLAEVRLTAIGR